MYVQSTGSVRHNPLHVEEASALMRALTDGVRVGLRIHQAMSPAVLQYTRWISFLGTRFKTSATYVPPLYKRFHVVSYYQ